MSLEKLVKAGVGGLLQAPVIGKLAEEGTVKAAKIIQGHFTYTSHEIGKAFQRSYKYAAAAIASGLVSKKQAEKLWSKIAESKVSREFSSQIHQQSDRRRRTRR